MDITNERFDVCVVGGGLVGLAVARAIAHGFVGASILVLEKEGEVAAHQSSHNSGVVHSGLYYRPGSLKARLCVVGRKDVYDMCADYDIPYRVSGKLVIATRSSEMAALDELERRGRANGLTGLRRLGAAEITEIEPAAAGLAALHVPEAGVADYPALALCHVSALESVGAVVVTGAAVVRIEHLESGVAVTTSSQRYVARTLVNCAGLHADQVAAMADVESSIRIIPFRGEYYRMAPEAAGLVRSLIYPVPDPRFPFLGVHFTRRIDDTVEVGPNAVLALGREHYRGAAPDWSELRSVIAYPGFRRLAGRHLLSGTKELVNSRSTRLYARLARRLIPALRRDHLLTGGAGVRAQAVDAQGNLVDDFVIETAGATVHVLNAPSPGATASIAIGKYVAAKIKPLLSH
ncbi:MAG: L-2-hydroxyglutarate oxidase [Acidimicrobiia bacterium]